VRDSLLADRRILVVEDEMMVLMLLEGMLQDLGCRAICSAATVTEALDLIAESTFDAATLDVNLGGSTSLPVANVLAGLGVPFAFATGYPNPRVLALLIHAYAKNGLTDVA
jgi:CheY-like chemotaxis protein